MYMNELHSNSMNNQLFLTEGSSRRLKLIEVVTVGSGVHVGLYYVTTWGVEELIDLSGTVSQEGTPLTNLKRTRKHNTFC